MPLISFITQPFQFVVHALDRLRYRWKFATLATVLVAAAVLLLQQMYADYREQVAATEREIAGLALSQQALDLLVNFQLQRGIEPCFAAHVLWRSQKDNAPIPGWITECKGR